MSQFGTTVKPYSSSRLSVRTADVTACPARASPGAPQGRTVLRLDRSDLDQGASLRGQGTVHLEQAALRPALQRRRQVIASHSQAPRRHALAIFPSGKDLLAFVSLCGLTTLPAALAGEALDLSDFLRGQAACKSRQALPSLPVGFMLFLQGGLRASGGLLHLVRAAATEVGRRRPGHRCA